jgi:hypothetical protein
VERAPAPDRAPASAAAVAALRAEVIAYRL